MIRTGWLVALFLTVAPWSCFGQFGGMGGVGGGMGGMGGQFGGMGGMGGGTHPQKPLENWTVKVETFGNQSVTGKLRLNSVTVQCELGTYEIKPEKIKTIEFVAADAANSPQVVFANGTQRNGSVTTATGEKVSGTVLVSNTWRIETDLGILTPDAQQLKSFTFVAKLPSDAEQAARQPVSLGKPGDQPGVKPGGNKPAEGVKPSDGGKPNSDPTKPEPSDGGKKPTEPGKTS